MKALRLTGIIFAVMSMVILASAVYAEEAAVQEVAAPIVPAISGEVVSVDIAASTIVVKQVTVPETQEVADVIVVVAPETKIVKGDAVLTLADLKAGDNVAVSKSVDAAGVEKVDSISVEVEVVPAAE